MKSNLNCEWMSLKLRSPLVVASLTPMSNTRIKEHIDFFNRSVDQGAGAIILPSINPERHGSSDANEEVNEAFIIDAGLSHKDHMGFSIMGPTVPNIVSVEYGLALAKAAIEKIGNTPIIASITNLGQSEQICEVVKQLDDMGIDGVEMNFSCPNVDTRRGGVGDTILGLIKNIRTFTKRPLSLKLSPYHDYTDLFNNLSLDVNSLTLSNAYIGLIPPRIHNGRFSPYDTADIWSPGGIYGPFERPLTYYRLFQTKDIARKLKIDIACAGGIISGDDAIQAILLGANVVQIASGIQWSKTSIFNIMNNRIMEFLNDKDYLSIAEVRGAALASIRESADEVSSVMRRRRAFVKKEICMGCIDCTCIDRLCFAISRGDANRVVIESELCSGCGWCVSVCKFKAISFEV